MQASEFAPLIDACCGDVLDSMYFTPIAEVQHDVPRAQMQEIAFALRFSGDICGRFSLGMPVSLARILTANFLGEEEDAVSPTDMQEVTGELANMLCGAIVSRIEGGKFALSHPEPVAEAEWASPAGHDRVNSTLVTDFGDLQLSIFIEDQAQSAGGDA